MKLTLFAVVVLTTVALGSSADPECVFRKKSGLDMHWANPENCGRFYRCSHGIKREIICPGDREYSSLTGKCVAAGMGTCNRKSFASSFAVATTNENDVCKGAANGEHLPKYGYCRNFYICQDNTAHEQNCDSGSVFDEKIAACVPDKNYECWQNTCLKKGNGYMFEDVYNCGKFFVCDGLEAVSQDCTSASYWNVAEDGCIPDKNKVCWVNFCLDQNDGVRLADATNQHIYYLCQNKQATLQTCDNDVFDPSTQLCKTVPSGETTTTTTTTACPSVTTTPACETAVTCSGGFKNGDFVPDTNNCMNFRICNDGEWYDYSCGAGNYFDRKLEVCEQDTKGECPQCQAALRKKRSVDTTLENCTCDGGYFEGDFVKHETDCEKFYICHDSELVLDSCKFGNYYDSCNKVCATDYNHTCWPVNKCDGAKNGTVLPNPAECNGYITCINNEQVYGTCEDTDYFDIKSGNCIPDTDLKCINPCVNVTKIEFMPYPTDCKKFYFCNAGCAYVESCLSGVFDYKRSLCLQDGVCASNVCEGQPDGTTYPITNSSKKFTVCIDGVPTTRSCLYDTIYNKEYGICLKNASNDCDAALCPTEVEYLGFSTINQDPDTFCMCQKGLAYEYSCPPLYTFNPDLGICYSNAPCDPDICDDSSEYYVSPNRNNSHAFCLCTDGVPVSVNCPDNGIFNPQEGTMGQCVSNTAQSDSECDEVICLNEPAYTVFPAIGTNLTGFCYCEKKAASWRACPADSTFNTDLNICKEDCAVEQCADKVTGFTFPDLASSSSFCYCLNSTAVVKRNCPTKEFYNDGLGICEREACDATVCANTTRVNEPFAAIDRPSSFCLCDGTTPRLFNCTNGATFNAELGICGNKCNSQCDVALCCHATAQNPYPIPAINNTQAFCYCFGPQSVEKFDCPSGTSYNAEKGVCLSPNAVNGCDCPGGASNGDFLPDKNNCRKYFICSNGQLKEGDCGAGNYFDCSCNYCKRDVDNVCPTTSCTCVGGYTDGEMLPYPGNCQLFYICTDGQLKEMDCGVGNYFSEDQGACVRQASGRHARSLPALTNEEEDVRMFKGLSNFFKMLTQF